MHFDGDEIRDLFGKNHGFDENSRMKVVEALVTFALKSNNAGVPSIVSALTAHENARAYIKSRIKNLHIIYVKCPIKICAIRDPKGLYKKAKEGRINSLIGYNSRYIPPLNPQLTIDTNKNTVEESAKKILSYLQSSVSC